jgi:hypothetical protein
VDIFGPSGISMIVTSTSPRIAVATIKAIIHRTSAPLRLSREGPTETNDNRALL